VTDLLPMELPESISSQGVSRARICRPRVAELELKASVQGYGVKCTALLASLDPNTQLWKTSGTSLLARTTNQADGSDVFSRTWPRSGMMRSGTAYQLRRLVPTTTAKESGLLPTPLKTDGFAIGQFSLETQLKAELRGYQRRFYAPLIINGYSIGEVCLTCEKMLGYPERWTELEQSATPSRCRSRS